MSAAAVNPDRVPTPSRIAALGGKLTILSLGWGTQSWALAAMVALRGCSCELCQRWDIGSLPGLDVAIHADTTWEMAGTYIFARQWTPWLTERGVRVLTESAAERVAKKGAAPRYPPAYPIQSMPGGNHHFVMIPAFTDTERGGRISRQCTALWKIMVVRRVVSRLLGERGLTKKAGVVEQWLGITTDEWERAKDADVRYVRHAYPLLDRRMSRADCVLWLTAHGLPVPPKSACTFCPYHNKRAWQEMKCAGGADWEQAVQVDAAIRDVRPPTRSLFTRPACRCPRR